MQQVPNKVITSDALLERLRGWAVTATAQGLRRECLSALRLMNRHLEWNAEEWGDPLFSYPAIQATECRGMIANWIMVWYGYHSATSNVVVHDILPALGSPLV